MFDTASRPTDGYGPAPTACFDPVTHLPVADPSGTTGCNITIVPHTHTGYDEGITGPAAVYWSSAGFTGSPVKRATGLGDPSQTLTRDWGQTDPVPADGAGHWSLRLSGLINLTAASYVFGLDTRQRADFYIDDHYLFSAQSTENPGEWAGPVSSPPVSVTSPGLHRIRIDYSGGPGGDGIAATYQPLNQASTPIPESVLDPDYGLATSTIDADGNTVTTAYTDTNGIGAEFGLATSTTQDPGGLALRTTASYEPPSSTTYLRRIKHVLPGQDPNNATTYAYYGGTEGPIAATCGVAVGTPQGGLLKQRTGPDPDGPGPQQPSVTQFVYDPAGRAVATRTSTADTVASAPWTCVTFDARGRVTQQSWPAHNGAPSRTTTYTYLITGNQAYSDVSDGTNTVSTSVDLLGRPTAYINGTFYQNNLAHSTYYTYDQPGRVTSTDGPQGMVATTYDPNSSRPSAIALDGTAVANEGYDTNGRLSTVTYANSTALQLGYDAVGNLASETFSGPSSTRILGDQLARSAAGRIIDEKTDIGGPSLVDLNPNNVGPDYTYDGAGRLATAYDTQGLITYDYSQSQPADGCLNPSAGADTNRTALTYTPSIGNPTSTRYCYDSSDRLTNIVGGSSVTYDDHGNTVSLNGVSYGWDANDHNTAITQGTTSVTYTRDPLERLMQRQSGASITRYLFGGFTEAPVAATDANGAVLERFLPLPGGVLLTKRIGGDIWSYPNLHGDLVATANSAGVRQSGPVTYDPYGAEDPAAAPIDNANDSADYGAFGSAQHLEEHAASAPVIQMGERPYVPTLGRFISVDPIEGGCANDYTYVFGDPLTQSDPSGRATNSCSDFTQVTNFGTVHGYISGGVFTFTFTAHSTSRELGAEPGYCGPFSDQCGGSLDVSWSISDNSTGRTLTSANQDEGVGVPPDNKFGHTARQVTGSATVGSTGGGSGGGSQSQTSLTIGLDVDFETWLGDITDVSFSVSCGP